MKKMVPLLAMLLALSSHAQREGIFNRIGKKDKRVDTVHTVSKTDSIRQYDRLSAGIGLGLDYGGIGTNTLFYFNQHLASFVGLGYDFNALGWNVGIKYRFHSKSRPWDFHPYVIGMYGINSIISVDNASQLNKSFDGFTLGAGFESRWKQGRLGYWSFGLLFPIKSEEAEDYEEELERVYGVRSEGPLLPVEIRISVGYHFVLNKMK